MNKKAQELAEQCLSDKSGAVSTNEVQIFLAGYAARDNEVKELEAKFKRFEEYNFLPMMELIDALRFENNELQAKLDEAVKVLERLTKVGPPSRSTTGLEYAQVALEDNCEIAKQFLKELKGD